MSRFSDSFDFYASSYLMAYKPPVVRHALSETDEHSFVHSLDFKDSPSLTQQHFANEVDINTIMARHLASGETLPPVNFQGVDVSDFPDFSSSVLAMNAAREQFDSLDPVLRARFHNDPSLFFDFASNPLNSQALVELGLASYPAAAPAAVSAGTSSAVPPAAAGDSLPPDGK
ncbi:MAG: internal scaffolding protein [Microvirus sp.]|nr:MAG: internal scaffolding protein [Microvirus sp.]